MIKCYANKHDPVKKVSVDADGTIEEMASDIGNITLCLYQQLKEHDTESAETFKACILEIFTAAGSIWMPLPQPPKGE